MSAARHAPLAIALLGTAALFPLTATFDRHRTPPPDVLQDLPPAALLPVLTFGHRQTAADVLEVRATNFLMSYLDRMNNLRHEHVARLYDAVLTLDPLDAGAYLRAATYLYAVAGRPDLARATLERGLLRVPATHPKRWRLYLELASLELLAGIDEPEEQRVARVRRAGKLLHEGEGVPPQFRHLGRIMATRGLSTLQALRFEEQQLWAPQTRQGEPSMRERALARLLETRAAIVAEALDEAARRFTELQGRAPADLAELQRFVIAGVGQHQGAGLALPEFLAMLSQRGFDDPMGVGFRLEGGRVIAPGVDAARLQRTLEQRLLAWQTTHPGRSPTLADLGDPAVPPHVEVQLDATGVKVLPR